MKKRISLALVLVLLAALSAVPVLAEDTFSITQDVQRVTLSNGITVVLKENPAFDIVAMVIMSDVGSVQDPFGLEGLTYLVQRNLISGTENRTSLDIITELESLGTQLQTTSLQDYSSIMLQCQPDNFLASFDIVLDLLNNSTFPEAEFERERALSLAVIQSLYDDPVNAMFLTQWELFYGDHPYRYSPYGSWEGVSAAQREQVKDWQKYMYLPQHLTVAVVGNFNSEELLPVLEGTLGSRQGEYSGSPAPKEAMPFVYPPEDREMTINLPTGAAFLMLGYPAPDTFNPDNAVMAVINSVLGDGLSSRLLVEIRDKLGLVYETGSYYDERLGPSNILTYAITHPDNVDLVREKITEQLQLFASEGLTSEEIAGVAAKLRGNHLLNNETNISQALLLATAEMTGRGYEWIDEYLAFFDHITPEDIKRVASEYFQNYTGILITP